MLIEFEVGNFLSFHQPMRLSMLAAKPFKEFEADNVFEVDGRRVLKSAIVYGANASGKSNLLAALSHMRRLVLNSSKEGQAGEPIDVRPFKLAVESVGRPSRFEVATRIDGIGYRYGFEADSTRIAAEWLFESADRKERALFLREGDGIDVRDGFAEGEMLTDKTRDNALFLSVAAQFNGVIASRILRWFREMMVLHGWRDDIFDESSVVMLQDPRQHGKMLELIRAADIGIGDIKVSKPEEPDLLSALLKDGKRPRFAVKDGKLQVVSLSSVHGQYSDGERVGAAVLDFDTEESEGTKKFFDLLGPVLKCLEDGGTAVIDEIDAKLHPLLTRAVVGLFNSKEANPRNAQLITCTHDTGLLRDGKFRRDQIWFVEKSRCEATDLYSLAEFKLPKGTSVRKDASFEKDYIQGRYGAIPFLGDFNAIFAGKE